MSGILNHFKKKARDLKREIHALVLAYKDPRVPWYAKVFLICVVGYALCPLDLIPDFIPVLGYLDDLILLPVGIWLAVKMIPPQVMAECRLKAGSVFNSGHPGKYLAAGMILAFWTLVMVLVVVYVLKLAGTMDLWPLI
jgi:uncharacterized membrane protein YkvA (DUF1232 family)